MGKLRSRPSQSATPIGSPSRGDACTGNAACPVQVTTERTHRSIRHGSDGDVLAALPLLDASSSSRAATAFSAANKPLGSARGALQRASLLGSRREAVAGRGERTRYAAEPRGASSGASPPAGLLGPGLTSAGNLAPSAPTSGPRTAGDAQMAGRSKSLREAFLLSSFQAIGPLAGNWWPAMNKGLKIASAAGA